MIKKSESKWIAGVIGGLTEGLGFGKYKDVVRIAYILLTLFTAAFPGLLIYLVLWILMPSE